MEAETLTAIAAIIAATMSGIASIIGALLVRRQKQQHEVMNSHLSKLAAAEKSVSFHEGRQEERESIQEQKEKTPPLPPKSVEPIDVRVEMKDKKDKIE